MLNKLVYLLLCILVEIYCIFSLPSLKELSLNTHMLISSTLAPDTFLNEIPEFLRKDIGGKSSLLKLIQSSPLTYQALLIDPVLRPVFLVSLDREPNALGSINILNRELVESLGGEDFIRSYSGFSVGSPEKAIEMMKLGYKFIVGVTDRFTQNVEPGWFNVANGRQCYFPLQDGTWLGVKGCGQFLDSTKPPVSEGIGPVGELRYNGLVTRKEIANLEHVAIQLKDLPAVQTIAYREIYKIPDAKGYLNDLQISYPWLELESPPVLVFNHCLTPHRLTKLGQILELDPDLKKMRASIFQTLQTQGIRTTPFHSKEDFLIFIFFRLGYMEAAKHKMSLFKETVHIQDFTFGGEEADNEEYLFLEEYIKLTHDENRHMQEELSQLKRGISYEAVYKKVKCILDIVCNPYMEKPVIKSSASRFPFLKAFFQGFFSFAPPAVREAWVRHLIGRLAHDLPLEVFHPTIVVPITRGQVIQQGRFTEPYAKERTEVEIKIYDLIEEILSNEQLEIKMKEHPVETSI